MRARDFKIALCQSDTEIQRIDGTKIWQPRVVSLDGDQFSRWLVKVHCGAQMQGKKRVNQKYAEYALGVSPADSLFVYLFIYKNQAMNTAEQRITYADFYDEAGETGFMLTFFGFQWLVTDSEKLNKKDYVQIGEGKAVPTHQFMNRPKEVSFVKDLGEGIKATTVRITIDWSE